LVSAVKIVFGMAAFYKVALSFLLSQIFNFALVISLAFFDDFFPVWRRERHTHPCQQQELRSLILPFFAVFWASYALIGELIEAHTLHLQNYSP